METRKLATTIVTFFLVVSTNLALAGHIEHESNQVNVDTNAVAEINKSQAENIQHGSTEKSEAIISNQYNSNEDPYKVYEIYRDLDMNLGS